jgi:ABC-type antimicrobial peptide transport system permease subunit
LVLQKAGRSCVKELRGLFPRAAVIDSDELMSALWGQLLLYLGSAALVALSTTAAVAALVYTYATTMYYTHFKEFAILRTLGLKKRGLVALALMLFALPAAAGSLTATALALAAPGVSTAQIAPIPPAVVTAATLLASAPALRRLYAITPAEALRTE